MKFLESHWHFRDFFLFFNFLFLQRLLRFHSYFYEWSRSLIFMPFKPLVSCSMRAGKIKWSKCVVRSFYVLFLSIDTFSFVDSTVARFTTNKRDNACTHSNSKEPIGSSKQKQIVKWRTFYAKSIHKLYREQCRRRATVKMKIDLLLCCPIFFAALFSSRNIRSCFKEMYVAHITGRNMAEPRNQFYFMR